MNWIFLLDIFNVTIHPAVEVSSQTEDFVELSGMVFYYWFLI